MQTPLHAAFLDTWSHEQVMAFAGFLQMAHLTIPNMDLLRRAAVVVRAAGRGETLTWHVAGHPIALLLCCSHGSVP